MELNSVAQWLTDACFIVDIFQTFAKIVVFAQWSKPLLNAHGLPVTSNARRYGTHTVETRAGRRQYAPVLITDEGETRFAVDLDAVFH